MSEDILWRQTRAGIWRVAGPGIVVHHTAEPGLGTDTRITAMWLPDRVLTGASAAILWPQEAWRDQLMPQRAMIIGPLRGRGPWRAVDHPGASSARVGGFLVASRHAIVVDLLRFLPASQGLAIGADALRTRLTTVEQLQGSVAALRGRDGVRQLRSIVHKLRAGAHSVAEVHLHAFLRRARLTGWVANHDVRVGRRKYRLDVAFLAEKVYLEYDGREDHSDDDPFLGDRERQNALTAAGWLPILVTAEMLRDPVKRAALLWQIRTALAMRSSSRAA
jgi:very-short-patch-repair endonuclease